MDDPMTVAREIYTGLPPELQAVIYRYAKVNFRDACVIEDRIEELNAELDSREAALYYDYEYFDYGDIDETIVYN